ncbi:type II toxin-antitoxin system YafQ family toxin [Helicobacter pylori]|uniref:type II toxin-antitoxin system YafQ family toxin n=1 Tax=Helicobacter pylori TaxID=210 RepID=UPI0012B3AA5D|nr:type II toxin-antitoxin system YafQ family toxin [Helicobacter pylori]
MLKLNLKKSFQKDFDKLLLNGFDDSVLNKVILSLRKKEPLDPQFQDHALKGKWKPFTNYPLLGINLRVTNRN